VRHSTYIIFMQIYNLYSSAVAKEFAGL